MNVNDIPKLEIATFQKSEYHLYPLTTNLMATQKRTQKRTNPKDDEVVTRGILKVELKKELKKELTPMREDIGFLKKYYFEMREDLDDLKNKVDNLPGKEFFMDMKQELADMINKRDLSDVTNEGRIFGAEENIRDHERRLVKLEE